MTTKEDVWFHWERNATFTPIFMCMEAWAEPTTKYHGTPWPTTICIWKNDLISWNNENEDFYNMGRVLVENFLKNGWSKFEDEINTEARKIAQFMKDSNNSGGMSEQELVKKFRELHDLWIRWFLLGVTEPVGVYGERVLEDLSKDKKDFSLLTTPVRKSFSRREFEDLLQIKSDQELEAHAKNYSWLHNNYFTTEVLGKEFFEEELKKIREKYPDPEQYLLEIEKKDEELVLEKEKAMNELGFNEEQRNLVKLMEFFAWFQDYRKEYTMKMLHYVDRLLEAIGKYHEFSLKEMKHTIPREIFENKFDKKLIQKRMAHFMVIWNSNDAKFEFLIDEDEIERKKVEIFGQKQHTKEIIEIEGSIANKGRVKGRAFVTMSAHDAKNIKQGEILVTSMTSPDFIIAIKRAAAIVTNEGGILCHAAVVSREFGVPCIVGTRNATHLIKTGDLIEVDGNHGFVRILKN